MKRAFTLLFPFFLLTIFTKAQSSDRWDEFGDRMARKAERLGQKAANLGHDLEYKLERSADRIVYYIEDWSDNLERRWSRKSGYFPMKTERFFWSEYGAFLGVESMQISDAKAKKLGFENLYGAYVTRVFPYSAADDAGLKPFDYVFGVNKSECSETQDLSALLAGYSPGDKVTIHLIRNGKQGSFDVRLGDADNYDFKDESGSVKLGVSPAINEKEADLDGVTIEVLANTAAAEMGLKNGDVIKKLYGFTILDWEDLTNAIKAVNPSEKVDIVFQRNGNEQSVSGTLRIAEQELSLARDRTIFERPERIERFRPEERRSRTYRGSSRGFLGINTAKISREKARVLGYNNTYGAYVTSVYRNSAAEKAGIMPFDYIIGIDKRETNEWNSLTHLLGFYSPGDKVDLHLIREGKKITVPVTLDDQYISQQAPGNSCDDPFLGVTQYSGRITDGVRIRPVKNSTAWDLGMQTGDVILYINGYQIIDWTDLTTSVGMLNPGMSITVEFRRDGTTIKKSAKIKSYAETHNCPDCNCNRFENFMIDLGDRIKEEVERFDEKPRARQQTSRPDLRVDGQPTEDLDFLRSKGIDISDENALNVNDLNLEQNSANGKFTLTFNLASKGDTVVKFFNSSGRTVYEYELGEFTGPFEDEIDLGQNGAGDYFLLIQQNNLFFSRKIILK